MELKEKVKTVRKLMYKRGHGKVINKQHKYKPHKQLGKHGIICTENLIYEIYTVGANNFL